MAEPTEGDRERAKDVVGHAHSGWCAAFDPTSPHPCHCRLAGIADAIAQALADERERATEAERSTWNPMIGRMLQVTQEWARLGGLLAAAAEQFHAAIAAEETGQ